MRGALQVLLLIPLLLLILLLQLLMKMASHVLVSLSLVPFWAAAAAALHHCRCYRYHCHCQRQHQCQCHPPPHRCCRPTETCLTLLCRWVHQFLNPPVTGLVSLYPMMSHHWLRVATATLQLPPLRSHDLHAHLSPLLQQRFGTAFSR
jgi:hypothetical protein